MARISQQSIAKQLGIAQITVSKALRGDKDISLETKEKVRKLADSLGYMPNLLARSLVEGRSRIIGIYIPTVKGRFGSLLVEAVEQEIRNSGYLPLFSTGTATDAGDNESLQILLQYRVAGIIICLGHACWRPSIIDQIIKQKIPLVFIGKSMIPETQCVYSKDYEWVKRSVAYLISKGHKNLLLISHFRKHNPISDLKEKGFIDALKENKIPYNPAMIIRPPEGQEYEYVRDSLKAMANTTAILCFEDQKALITINVIEDSGLKVPDDISVMGYGDNVDFEEYMRIPITSVSHDPETIGKKSVELLFAQIRGENISKEIKIELENRIIERRSVKDISK